MKARVYWLQLSDFSPLLEYVASLVGLTASVLALWLSRRARSAAVLAAEAARLAEARSRGLMMMAAISEVIARPEMVEVRWHAGDLAGVERT